MNFIINKLLRRPFFRGQDRIFNFLFKNKFLQKGILIGHPLLGNFKISCDTNSWIGSRIIYLGDYEGFIKEQFKTYISTGDTVLDIGANIGFHSLYFSELVGSGGKVICFEPVLTNFNKLKSNIILNQAENIWPHNIALGNKNENISIAADENSTNPGSFNLFERGGDEEIICRIGDEVLAREKVNFIKIDVEGYESYVIGGLIETITNNRPKILFEYDPNYIVKSGLPKDYIFKLLSSLNYSFLFIYGNRIKKVEKFDDMLTGDILALPNE
ncbi:MAG: FkbM family methyltransferase [Flavobacterium sp.]|nr:MAG: FkbM family methyltransferase [Flavobacterium sp.]